MITATFSPSEPVLVATKLHVPPLRPGLVRRGELLDRLVAERHRKLTVVCAPAGWGKSTLPGEWGTSADETRPFAWLSLDPADSDPVRFWSYAIGALREVRPGFGAAALDSLRAAGTDLVDVVVAPLINELADLPGPLVLVLDDYHAVQAEAIHASLAFLLRHAPATLHVAIATRVDPPLRLGTLRAAGQVTGIRATNLRFSATEAEHLLNGSLGLGFDSVELLRARTEGWAAGLQLAALSALNAFGDLTGAATHIERHFDLVTTELVPAPALTPGGSLTLDLAPGRTYAIPIPVTAGQRISVATSSRDAALWDSIALLRAPDGSPAVGSDDDNGYFAAFDWVAEETGTYTMLVSSFEAVTTGELVVTRD